jgi:ubiquinone/menaquinone biosynthesis C-methylase UbiE
MVFYNSYNDETRADAYAKLDFSGTYYLAFRDIPRLIATYVMGTTALDFGCGTGRSTRFLQHLGFKTLGVDISQEMITQARKYDSKGTYQCIDEGDFRKLPLQAYNLILSAFTFDNVPQEKKGVLFQGLATLLAEKGVLINLVSTPEMYIHEWTSFTTKDFPENTHAKSGDVVRIITKNFADNRPCYDILCLEEEYHSYYSVSGLRVLTSIKPLAQGNEPYHWVNEKTIAPWRIDVLQKTFKI